VLRNDYLREIVRIPVQGGTVGAGDRYRLHRGNLAMNFLFVLNFNMYVEMPRQHGKTIAALVRYLWVYNFGTSNSEIAFLHKDHTGSKKNLRTLKEIRENLPSYLQLDNPVGADGKKIKVRNTVVAIDNPYNHNKIITFASARTKDLAQNLGRGSTQPIQYYDEFAFIPYNKTVYLAATPAYSTASMNAARNGAPYGILLTSTPGDLLTDSGSYAYKIRNDATPFRESFYDKTYEDLVNIKNCNTNSEFFMISYTYQQLGSGQEYFKRMVREMGGEWVEIRREVMLEWAETSGNCPFAPDDLEKIKMNLKRPINQLTFGQFGQYTLDIYEEIDTNYPPIIGVDVSGATYNDSSAITIIDSKTTRVIATLNCNFIPADDLADVIYNIVTKYLPNAIVNVERNGGYGAAVVQRLLKTSVKNNLYWEIKDKVMEEAFDGHGRSQKIKRKVRTYGLDSTKNVRARLIEILTERVMYHKDKFNAEILYNEMRAMEVKKNGKVEHSDKTHDDQVFSYLMALYVWYDGKDLVERFNIRKSVLKTDTNEEINELNIDDTIDETEELDLQLTVEDETGEYEQTKQFLEESSKFETSASFRQKTSIADNEFSSNYIRRNKIAREAYRNSYGVDANMDQDLMSNMYVELPQHVYINTNEFPEEMFDQETGEPIHQYLQGNLAKQWDSIGNIR